MVSNLFIIKINIFIIKYNLKSMEKEDDFIVILSVFDVWWAYLNILHGEIQSYPQRMKLSATVLNLFCVLVIFKFFLVTKISTWTFTSKWGYQKCMIGHRDKQGYPQRMKLHCNCLEFILCSCHFWIYLLLLV